MAAAAPRGLPRRMVLAALAASACAPRTPELPRLGTFLGALPSDVAGAAPYQPERLGGQVVLVTFVATWCFPCLAELLVLTRLARELGERGFANVLVGMDLEGHRVLDPFAQSYELPGPLLVADDRLRAGETPFGLIRELPSRVLFGRDGRPVLAFSGVVGYPDLSRVITAELDKR
jgi:thiol-disulfide isomerase/thioredoxin